MAEIMTTVRKALTAGPLGSRLRVTEGKWKGFELDAVFDALCEMVSLNEINGFDGEDAEDNGHGFIRIAA